MRALDAQAVELRTLRGQIAARLEPEGRRLLLELDDAYGRGRSLDEDRLLRVVGVLLAQEGLGDVFERLFSVVVSDGVEVAPGDGQRFLRRQLAEGN